MKYLWDTDTCIYYLNEHARIRQKVRTIGDFDLLIASFALHYKMIIVTNNTDHFNRIPDIRLENWACKKTDATTSPIPPTPQGC